MDKVAKYQRIIRDVLDDYAAIRSRLTPQVKRQVILDDAHGHYQLVSVGWHNNQFIYTVSFHFDLIGGKIWIQQNNTEAMIADELIERGVDRLDIILGFLPERVRGQTGFAVL